MPVYVTHALVIPDTELQWRFTTSSGPGGQHANRSNTRAELLWNLDESTVLSDYQRRRIGDRIGRVVRVVVDEHRSQLRNRHEAEQRLAERCRGALSEPKQRKKTKPSRASKRRRLDAKRRDAKTKQLRRRPAGDD